ncbi:Golgi-associated plant pathogenesis-related protein 1 isoform X1 [Drosophila takahashii]|uniref:Golgi-associated plant pathogenesis-related protein 1 isoform X1 n=1 Tax=Drosophila takahashii TaxID=29030 RepID=UPI003898DCE2
MHFKIICFFMALECNGVFCIGLRSLILEAHNRRRAKYGNQPLVLDEKLSEECKKYAQQLVADGEGCTDVDSEDEMHSDELHGLGPIDGNYTQNICVFHDAKPRACVRDWFHYRGYRNNRKYYQFTAMIWNASTKLGVGLARIKDTRYLVVRYAPPGNILKDMQFNVPKRLTHFWDKYDEAINVDYDDNGKPSTTTDLNSGSELYANWLLFITYILVHLFSSLWILWIT